MFYVSFDAVFSECCFYFFLFFFPSRYDSTSGGEREIQRTMLELLNQLDGFDSRGDVKVIMATNKIETLDPALIRPGRIDRKIEFPLPDIQTKRRIFTIHTGRMTLADDVDVEELVMAKDDLSGADVKAICTEAGLLALRERRMKVKADDFKKAKEKVFLFLPPIFSFVLLALLTFSSSLFDRLCTRRTRTHPRGFTCNLRFCNKYGLRVNENSFRRELSCCG